MRGVERVRDLELEDKISVLAKSPKCDRFESNLTLSGLSFSIGELVWVLISLPQDCLKIKRDCEWASQSLSKLSVMLNFVGKGRIA